jgi:preprotein translocase subunit SecD
VPGVDDPERLKAAIGTTAKLTFHMVVSDGPADIARAEQGRVSPFQLLLPTESPTEPKLLVQRRAALAGENLRNSSQGFDSQGGEPVVNFSFDTAGATTFCKLTRENIRKRFAVVLDGTIITAPSIRSAICGGTGFIEGNFTVESASDLAALLNAGALPAPLTIVEERTVGAGLGQDSIDAGRVALIIGFIAVMVFMLMAYSLFGLFSNIALLLNVALIAGALSALGATLTLPGIAGIVLTIGMAVDANVLIYERIREEIRSGRSVMNALEAGYAHAQSAIVDANVTTFIAAAILFFLGSGPVQGFAVTLGIGIVTSVFTAFVVTRLMVVLWYQVARPRAMPI